MYRLEKSCLLFLDMIRRGVILANPYLSFETICRFLRVSPADLDEYLLDELGATGEMILRAAAEHHLQKRG